MKKVFIYCILVVFLAGCTSLRGIMKYSKEQDALQRYVADQKKKTERLFKDIEENELAIGMMTKQEVMRRYGDPVLMIQTGSREEWLYREAMEYFPAKKAYLVFDGEEILSDIRVVLANQ